MWRLRQHRFARLYEQFWKHDKPLYGPPHVTSTDVLRCGQSSCEAAEDDSRFGESFVYLVAPGKPNPKATSWTYILGLIYRVQILESDILPDEELCCKDIHAGGTVMNCVRPEHWGLGLSGGLLAGTSIKVKEKDIKKALFSYAYFAIYQYFEVKGWKIMNTEKPFEQEETPEYIGYRKPLKDGDWHPMLGCYVQWVKGRWECKGIEQKLFRWHTRSVLSV